MKKLAEIKTLPDTLAPFVWRYLKNKKIYLVGFLLVALVWAIEMSLTPYLLKIIIDTVDQHSHDQTKMLAFILIPAGVYVVLSIIINFNFRLYDYINLRVYPELKAAVTYDMFAYLMQHSHSFFLNNFAGSLNKRISDMATNIEYVIRIPNDWFYPRIFAMLIASVTLFTVVHPIFGIILFTWATGFIGFSYISARRAEKLSNAMAEALTKMSGTISDSISNVMSTKLFSNIPHELSLVQQNVGNVVNCDRNLLKQNLKVNFVQGIGVTLLLSSMIIALIYGNTQGWITAGDFALVLMLSNWFIFSIFNIGQEMQRFSRIVGICNQALSFIKVPHEIVDAPNALPINIAHGTIKFQNVSFQYLQDQSLFNQLNVTIQAGEKVGLVGYSGGGKTTFIKLLLRLMDIQSGAIMIDGQDIKSVTKSSLRKQISTIPQEPELFHRTIMENIRFARPDATDLEVIEAAQQAKCDEFILQLPQQYHSLVGERGVKLSGGQKQRIAIARAFLKNAPILLLDEATSSLDSVTERYVQESLHNVMLNKTTIVIAHRLSTLKDMTRILVFSHGVIVEDGSLDSLLKDPDGHFYKLWKMQAEGFLPTIRIA